MTFKLINSHKLYIILVSDDTVNLLSTVIYYCVYLLNRYIHLNWQLPNKHHQSNRRSIR